MFSPRWFAAVFGLRCRTRSTASPLPSRSLPYWPCCGNVRACRRLSRPVSFLTGQPVQRLLRLGIQWVGADRQCVPGAGQVVELEGRACRPKLAHEVHVISRFACGSALDQRVEVVEVCGRLAVRLGGFGMTGSLQSRRQAKQRFATQRIGGECGPEVVAADFAVAAWRAV